MNKISLKKSVIVLLDLILAVYLVFAMTSFNRPDESKKVCTDVSINITDGSTYGFLKAKDIKSILERKKLYPYHKPLMDVNPRTIEEALKVGTFINTAQCYKTQDGHVYINVTQRLPIVRVKNDKGEDYYVDDKGNVMPTSRYTSDLIICTGNISQTFAKNQLVYFVEAIMADKMWMNLVEQINVLPDQSIEIVPRVGNHIVHLGRLPYHKVNEVRKQLTYDMVNKKMTRLMKFYRYGLSQAGWNRYSYINLEFDNQIVCKKIKVQNK